MMDKPLQVPDDVADLLTKWVQEHVSVAPEKDLRHLVTKFQDAGVSRTKQLVTMSKQDRNVLFRELAVSTADKVTLMCMCQQLDSAQSTLIQNTASPPRSLLLPVTSNAPTAPFATPRSPLTTHGKKYVGIFNQGATCYLNSLLQALFHITEFRRAVYSITTDEQEDAKKSIPLALQRLFYDLEFGRSPASTKMLTASFGWTHEESFIQHDIQELLRKLSDNLDAKMKGTPAEGSVGRLFCGRMVSYVRCMNSDHTSARDEEFYDLQLSVRGCRDVYSSFKAYTAVELLNEKNKYAVDRDGKVEYVDAEKGVWFQQFPPVLMLHLRRFEYNVNTDAMGKLHDYYEYYEEIDLSPFLVPESLPFSPKVAPSLADGCERTPVACNGHAEAVDSDGDSTLGPSQGSNDIAPPATSGATPVPDTAYVLYSVLVHSGGSFGGHYYAYVRPDNGAQWLKFNDSVVSEANLKEVLQANFGQEEAVSSSTTAYMLIYMRRNCAASLVYEMTEAQQPHHLKDHIQKERSAAEADRRRKEEDKRKVQVRVWTEDAIRKWNQENPLSVWNATDYEGAVVIPKDAPLQELLFQVEERHGVPAVKQRLWLLGFPALYIQRRPEGKLRDLLQLSRTNDHLERAHVFVQCVDWEDPECPSSPYPDQDVARDEFDPDPQRTLERRFSLFSLFSSSRNQAATLLFVNYFDRDSKAVTFCGAHTFMPQTPMVRLFQAVAPALQLPPDPPLRLFVMGAGSAFQVLDSADCLGGRASSGDVVWLQLWTAPTSKGLMPVPPVKRFTESLRQRREVTFVRHDYAARYWQLLGKKPDPGGSPPPFEAGAVVTLCVQLLDTYSVIQAKLGAALQHANPTTLRLWCGNAVDASGRSGPYPKPEATRDGNGREATLATISGQAFAGGRGPAALVLYWDELEVPVAEHEVSAALVVHGAARDLLPVGTRTVRVARDLPLERLAERLSVAFAEAGDGEDRPDDSRRCLWTPRDCWLVAVKGAQVQIVFGHDCTRDVIVPKPGITAGHVLEELSKGATLRYEPQPRPRLGPSGALLPGQRWAQVVHFDAARDFGAPVSPALATEKVAPFAVPVVQGEQRIRLHSTPFLLYVSAEDTGASLLRYIETDLGIVPPSSPPPSDRGDPQEPEAEGERAAPPPSAAAWSLAALEHMRDAVWRVRPIHGDDVVLSKLAAGKRACLGLLHAAPDPKRRDRTLPRRATLSSAGPELKIFN